MEGRGWWPSFLGMIFFSPLGCTWCFFWLAKIFFSIKNRTQIEESTYSIFFCHSSPCAIFFFFCEKKPLNRRVGVYYGRVNGWVSEWVSEWVSACVRACVRAWYVCVRAWVSEWVSDVCMSHQSDWLYYKQPIKFLVVKVNGMWEDLIPIQFYNGHSYSSIKEEEVFIYWAYFDIFCGLG